MVLRFTTAGSVDDGKSTLIGRLLHDSKSLYDDQWEAVQRASSERRDAEVDLALLTDGLRAEREQRITIDVAYRYFATPERKFIIADTPGHEQYTRNMVTGASTAELAIVLVDARKGLTTQTRRHAYLASLLGIPHLVLAVNKMDMVDYAEATFQQICSEFAQLAQRLHVEPVSIPISALRGDNVVDASENMAWYSGPTLLRHLETVSVGGSRNLVDFRFPIQYVVRPNQDFRGFAGQISSGRVRAGEAVQVLPAGKETRIRAIVTADGELQEALAGDSVVLALEHEIDASRGSWLAPIDNLPQRADDLDVTLCWFGEEPLRHDGEYVLIHSSQTLRCYPKRVDHRVDVNTAQELPAQTLGPNDIGRVQLALTEPVYFDPYKVNRATGSLILIDPATNNTVAAGMIRGKTGSRDIFPSLGPVSLKQRELRNGHKAAVVWLTGLSGSGKSSIARLLEERLYASGVHTMPIDGDNLRHGLCADLGFDADSRRQNVRRAAYLAQFAFEHGQLVICSLISPFKEDREFARGLLPSGRFLEVHVACTLDTCQQRDPKGLYAKALSGEIAEFTGISSPYETPAQPDLRIDTEQLSVEESVERLIQLLSARGIL